MTLMLFVEKEGCLVGNVYTGRQHVDLYRENLVILWLLHVVTFLCNTEHFADNS